MVCWQILSLSGPVFKDRACWANVNVIRYDAHFHFDQWFRNMAPALLWGMDESSESSALYCNPESWTKGCGFGGKGKVFIQRAQPP